MPRQVLLTLEYDGTDFAGFQRQAAQPTIQAEVESAIERLTGRAARLRGAGRTDAGVHAAAMPASFWTDWPDPLDRLVAGLNHFLPPAIVVRAARSVPDAFDPRRSALWRRYRYTVIERRTRSPLQDRYAYQVAGPLDRPAIRAALARLPGVRDFASFAATLARGGTVRHLREARLIEDGERLIFEFVGNAFLAHQIRNTVGTLLWIGERRWAPDDVDAILAARDRRRAGPAAPPRGLCLIDVDYLPDPDAPRPPANPEAAADPPPAG